MVLLAPRARLPIPNSGAFMPFSLVLHAAFAHASPARRIVWIAHRRESHASALCVGDGYE